MNCINCGAKLEKTEINCPYCGAENEQAAKKEHDKVLREYKHKTKELSKLPDKVVNKVSGHMLKIAIGLVCLMVVGCIISFAISKSKKDNSLDVQAKHLARLEEYYNADKYEEMYEYLSDKGLYAATYQKYWRIAPIGRDMEWRLEAIRSENEFVKLLSEPPLDVKPDDVMGTMNYIFSELSNLNNMKIEGFPYGEGDKALEIMAIYQDALAKYMLLTEEEIEEGTLGYGNDEIILELATKAVERIRASEDV
ncbi:MAG: zinc ribbon domain-containing protein [Lachnospiraceae bacterium]|nr:zinc ribbon domain-containing protein [Lachnospiraceae bacterium]